MRTYVAVGFGGALGAAIRAFIIAQSPDSPWVIASINVIGCAVLAIILTRVVRRFTQESWHEVGRPFLASGVMGGFTTTSAFAINIVDLLNTSAVEAIAYLLVSVVGGYFAFDFIARSAKSPNELAAP